MVEIGGPPSPNYRHRAVIHFRIFVEVQKFTDQQISNQHFYNLLLLLAFFRSFAYMWS